MDKHWPVLIVAAHPDDEVLGCGAVGAALASSGHLVRTCFISSFAEARGGLPSREELIANVYCAQRELGFGEPFLGEFANLKINNVPHLELVQFVEHAIVESAAQIIFTHHPADLNDDHVHTARACMAAARLFQRRAGIAPLRRLYLMEVLSSTDWAFSSCADGFRADTYFEVGPWLDKKLSALRAYRGVMRDFPHPRSEQVIRGLAAYRGGQAGLNCAEAFQTAFAVGSTDDV